MNVGVWTVALVLSFGVWRWRWRWLPPLAVLRRVRLDSFLVTSLLTPC